MEMAFCRRCGKPLEHLHHHVYACANGHTVFANSSPAVGVFLVSPDRQKVLLITRGAHPGKGMLGIPGGFLDSKESFEQALKREIQEEISLSSDDYGSFTYVTSAYDSYLYQKESVSVITVLFWAEIKHENRVQTADDVEAVNWYALSDIDLDRVHAHDVRTGLRAVQRVFGDNA